MSALKRNIKGSMLGLSAGACLLFSLFSCKSGAPDDGRQTVAVSFAPQQTMVSQLWGDSTLSVITLLPPGADPEHFEPSIRDLRSLAKASAWLSLNSDGFEQSLLPAIHSNFPDLRIAVLSPEKEQPEEPHEHGEQEHEGHRHGPNNHLLSSLRNAQSVLSSTAGLLVSLDPSREQEILRRRDSIAETYRLLDDSIASLLRDRQVKGFVIYHPSLTYFARDYGLTQLAIQHEGKEPSPKQMANLFRQAREQGIGIFITETDHPSPAAESLARSMGFRLIPVSLLSPSYPASLRALAQALAQ